MKYFFNETFSEKQMKVYLTEAEQHHASKVMRLKDGDKATILNGNGLVGIGHIHSEKKEFFIEINETTFSEKKLPEINLFVGVLKSRESIEWLVEKSVELECNSLTFFVSQNCERKKIEIERLKKITVSALKQSGNPWLPEIKFEPKLSRIVVNTKDFNWLIAHCKNGDKKYILESLDLAKNTCLLIGPEGDFTSEEIKWAKENGVNEVSLGNLRLRTETAALFSLSVLHSNLHLS